MMAGWVLMEKHTINNNISCVLKYIRSILNFWSVLKYIGSILNFWSLILDSTFMNIINYLNNDTTNFKIY